MVIYKNIRHRIRRPIAFRAHVEMSVVGEGNFIEKAGTENVIFDHAKVVKVIDSRGGNRPATVF